MEAVGRDPAKLAQIEASLQSIKGSKAYGNIEEKIRSGIYRTSRSAKNKNRNSLEKKKIQLTRKLESGESKQMRGNTAKVEKIGTLLSIINEETNVENANNDGNNKYVPAEPPPEVNRKNIEGIPPLAVAAEEVNELPIEPLNKDEFGTAVPPAAQPAPKKKFTIRRRLNNALNFAAAAAIVPESQTTTVSDIQDALLNNAIEEPVEDIVEKKPLNADAKGSCHQLFDPCTGTPLEPNTIQTLEKRIREIRSMGAEHPDTEQFPSTIKTRLELLIDLLKKPVPPNGSLFKYTINGQLYEAYWDIVFALNLLDDYQRTPDFFMVKDKAELIRANDSEKAYSNNPIEYLHGRNVNEGASGASDISFCYKNPKRVVSEDSCNGPSFSKEACALGVGKAPEDTRTRFYLCSSKFYRKDSKKSVESFDIQKIYIAAKKLHSNSDVRIILLVKNKSSVDKILRNARNKYISEEACKTYGEEDLFAALLKIYNLAHQKITGEINETSLSTVLGITDTMKPILSPRLHQHMAILKIQKAVTEFKKSGGKNKFLVGILPRGGKTYIAGGIVSLMQPKRVVVLLGAKSETISQFTNDLFNYYQDFSDYQIVDVLEGGSDKQIDPAKKYIFVMSVELYKQGHSSRPLLQDLKGGANRADLFICDEAHLKQTTEKAIKELEDGTVAPKLASEEDKEEESGLGELDEKIAVDVPVVYMTGTYIKPLSVFKIPEDHVAIWDYEDIQQGKNIVDNQEYFKENFPGIYEEALAKCFAYGETFESIQAMYRRFPNLYLLSTQFTDGAKGAFLEQSKAGERVGFPTITHLFQVKKEFVVTGDNSLWHTGFTNPRGMARLINYLSPRNEIVEEGVEAVPSVMGRIDRISQRIGDRLAFFTKDFVVHSQLWFLPTMQGHPLIKRMCALAGTVFLSPWYKKNFNVLGISSSADWSQIPGAKEKRVSVNGGTFIWACPSTAITLKDCILREEAEARSQGKGLVILAQNMLHLGISLSCVDIVVLLDAGEKVDERIQKMYRALTESTNKKGGFIVDMNYFRTVTAIMNYQITTSESRQNKKIYVDSPGFGEAFNSMIETYSIDDDLDIYGTKEEGGGRIASESLPELQRMFKKAPTARGDGMALSSVGAALNRNIETGLKGEYDSGLDDILGEVSDDLAKKALRENGSDVQAAEEEKEEDEKGRKRGLLEDVLPTQIAANPVEKRKAFEDMIKTTLKLGVFGTNYKTVAELIVAIREDRDEIREVIYDTLMRRGAIQEDSDIEKVFYVIMKGLEVIDNKKFASYSVMKESFNARDSRSQKFQEVLEYIKEHLTPKDKERHKFGEVFTPLDLVDEMLSKLPPEVWKKKDWKWLDPANGIGNFPIKAFMGQSEGEYKYPGLFEGLRKEIPDDGKRCKWIIENMLYMIDINGKNNMVAKKLFEKLCPGAKANIEQIDKKNGFLTDKPLTFNGKEVNEFDVVIGNPPFQGGAVRGKTTNKTHKMRVEMDLGQDKHKNLWIPFVKKILSTHLKKNGYLLFIHPIGWFKPERTGIHEDMLKYQIKDMRIYDMYQSMKRFSGKGKISVAYYLLENKPIYTTTTIIDRVDKKEIVQLNSKSIIILANNSIFSKIQKKASLFYEGGDLKVTSITSAKCNTGSNKQIHRISEAGEITFVKTGVEHTDQGNPKLYLSGYQNPRFYHDKEGVYGLIGSHQHYFIGNNLDKLENYFKTKLSAILLKHTKYDQEFIEPKYYPDVRTLPLEKITDETLADYFAFTKEERAAINAIEYPKREYKFKEITCAQLKGEKVEAEEATEGGGAKKRNFTRKVRRT